MAKETTPGLFDGVQPRGKDGTVPHWRGRRVLPNVQYGSVPPRPHQSQS
jgi:hypothetical protein